MIARRTYWHYQPRDFSNEYDIGVATTISAADRYLSAGYWRISRRNAIRMLRAQGDDATQIYATATLDHVDVDRREFGRLIASGDNPAWACDR